MKKIIILCAVLNSQVLLADIDLDRKKTPMRKTSSDAFMKASSIATPYLRVVPDRISFPAGSQKEKLLHSFELIEKVINSEEFKLKVIGYVARDGKKRFTSNQNLTNEQVYLKLMQGSEVLLPETVNEMNFNLTKYFRRFSKVIGYTKIGKSQTIKVNWRFYRSFDVHQMAANITYEWIHLMGFYHDSASDSDSVPYAVGDIMEELVVKELNTK